MGSNLPLTNNPEISEAELRSLHSKAYHWALSLCQGESEDAKEVMQKVYLKVYEGRARYKASPPASFKTWFFAVIKVTAKEHRRQVWKSWFREGPTIDLSPRAETSDTSTPESQDQRERVIMALKSLPTRQRETIELVTYHDLTVDEVALVLGISTGSARTQT